MFRTYLTIRIWLVLLLMAANTQSPTAPGGLIASNRTQTSISLSWSAAYDDTGVKGYQVFRDGKKIISTSKLNYTNSDLVPGRKYAYAVKAYDAAGNLSESSTVLYAATISDYQSPSPPSGLSAAASSFTSITLAWEASTDNVSVKNYEVFRNGQKTGSTSDTQYECKRLIPGTVYTFHVKAYDKAGNASAESSRISARTVPDLQAPTTPTGLKAASVTVAEANLIWTPSSDNVKVKGYEIFRDGAKIGTTTKTSYCSKSLAPGKSYEYAVRASDASGNLSKNSSTLRISTLKDSLSPTAPAELKISKASGSSVSLAWTASTDNAKVSGYQIYCNGIVIATAARTTRTVKSPFGLGIDLYWVKAYDQAGNLSGSSNKVTAVTLTR